MKLIHKDAMLDILDSDDVVEDTVIGKGRWTVRHRLVFLFDDKHYRTTYEVGATENQDTAPWEYVDEVPCEEVHQVEQTVLVWVPVAAA